MDRWYRLVAVARRQGGVVGARQAEAVGVPRSTFMDRVRREGWTRPFRGVAVLPGVAVDHAVLARAATVAADAAVVTGWSALFLDGVADTPPVRVHLLVPHARRVQLSGPLRVTRSRTLRADDARSHAGLIVATAPRALLDAAARAGTDRLRSWLIDGRQRRRLSVHDVAARAAATAGVPGRGRLLRACHDVDASAADSVLVAEVERRLREQGFLLDVPPRPVDIPGGRTLHPDLTVVGVRVGIEVDGFGTHRSRTALDLDQRKHNGYTLAGWLVLRIGWTRLSEDWAGFVAELRRAVVSVGSP